MIRIEGIEKALVQESERFIAIKASDIDKFLDKLTKCGGAFPKIDISKLDDPDKRAQVFHFESY